MNTDLTSIKWIVLDVDGTMTDGGVYIDNNQVETKKFSIKDGAGIVLAQKANIEIIILTGRESNCVSKRAEELNITKVFQNVHYKRVFIEEYAQKHQVSLSDVAYIGDDLNDLPVMKIAGISACPSDAASEVKEYCDFVLEHRGGDGVVREFIEKVLKAKGIWEETVKAVWG